MPRASRSNPSRSRRNKVLKAASGYRSSRRYKIANERVAKGLQHQYKHRRTKKREMRNLWIIRINAALKQIGMKYSIFINMVKKSGIDLNRKTLAKLAMENTPVFNELAKSSQENTSKVTNS